MSDRGHAKLVLMGQVQTVQTIDQLSAVGHGYLLGVTVKGIERQAAKDRVPQGWCLFEDVTRSRLTAPPVPRSPFVHYEFNRMIPVEFSHHLPVPVDQGFHDIALAQELIPVHGLKLERVTFSFNPVAGAAPAQVPGVVVERQTIDGTEVSWRMTHDLFQKPTRPIAFVIIGSGGDERQLLSILRHPGSISAEFHGILLRRKIAAAAPRLVTDAPISNCEG